MLDYPAFAAFVFITAFTPGPNNSMAMSHAASKGLKKGFLFSSGVFFGMLAVMLACGLSSSFLARNLVSAEQWMKIAGAAYMTWLAWSLWGAGALRVDPARERRRLFLSGCGLQLVNPKIIIYGLTAFSGFILPFYSSGRSLVLFAALLALVGFLGTMAWAAFGAALEKVFQRHPRAVNRSLSVMMAVCALSMLR